MLKDITLGQFFPGDTVAHRLDPRTKILLVVLYIVALFCAKSLLAYGILAAVLAVCVRISRVGIKSLVRGLKPVVFIIVFTGILNLFFTPGEHILAELGFLRISAEGLQNAVFMVLRIMLLIMGTFLMTYTTALPGARAGHDDEHRPAVHPNPDRGDRQDHVRSEGPGRGL